MLVAAVKLLQPRQQIPCDTYKIVRMKLLIDPAKPRPEPAFRIFFGY